MNFNWFQLTNKILNGTLLTPQAITQQLKFRSIKNQKNRSQSLQHNFKYSQKQEAIPIQPQRASKFLTLKNISQKVIKRNSKQFISPPIIPNENERNLRNLSCYCTLCGKRSYMQLKNQNVNVGIAYLKALNRKSTKRSLRNSYGRNTSIVTGNNSSAFYRMDSMVSQLSEETHVETREPPRKKKTIFMPKNYQFQLIKTQGSIQSFEDLEQKESIGHRHLKQLFHQEKLKLIKSKRHFHQKSLNLINKKTDSQQQMEQIKIMSLADFEKEQTKQNKKKNYQNGKSRIKCSPISLMVQQKVQMEQIYKSQNERNVQSQKSLKRPVQQYFRKTIV